MISGPLLLLAALVAGQLAGRAAGPAPATGALVVGAVLAVAAFATRRRVRLVIAMLACSLLGLATMQRALHGIAVSPLRAPVLGYRDVEAQGALVADPSDDRFSTSALLRVATFRQGDGPSRRAHRTVLLVASAEERSAIRLLAAGDRVVVRGRLEPLRPFDGAARRRHAVGRLVLRELVAFGGPADPLARAANTLRQRVLAGTAVLPARDRGLLAGFLLGDTRGIPPDTADAFRGAGLSHLLAVSGANVAFVLVLAGPLLRRLPITPRALAGIAVVVLFGTMTRWEPSVLRASTMTGLAMVASLAGRPTSGPRVLVIAAGALLLADPFLLTSVGFLLSCGAAAGIVLLAAPIAARLRGPRVVRDLAGVTLAAQVGVAPVLLPVFGSVPAVVVLANLLAVPVAEPLTVWGLAAGVIGGVTGPDVAHLLQIPTALMLGWIRTVAVVASGVPLRIDGRALWGLGAVGAAVLGLRRALRRGPPAAFVGRRSGAGP